MPQYLVMAADSQSRRQKNVTRMEIVRCLLKNIHWFDTYKCWDAELNCDTSTTVTTVR